MPVRPVPLALTTALLPATAMAEAIHTAKSPTCGCCGAWVEHMAAAGHEMSVEDMNDDALAALKMALGIPEAMASCHTARVEGYVIEGTFPRPMSSVCWPSGRTRSACRCPAWSWARPPWVRARAATRSM